MKKYNIIFISILISFLLYFGFEISAGKINFGSAFWKDTLSNRITTNKAINLRPGDSLYYNGKVITSGEGIDTSKVGFVNQSNSWSALNEFTSVSISTSLENIGNTTLGDVTITGNTDISGNNRVTGYSSFGSDAPSIKMKLLRAKITATNVFVNMPHGLNDYRKIRGIQLTVLRDTTGTTNRVLNLGYNAFVPLVVTHIVSADTTNVITFIPLNSTALIGDSIRALVTYEE